MQLSIKQSTKLSQIYVMLGRLQEKILSSEAKYSLALIQQKISAKFTIGLVRELKTVIREMWQEVYANFDSSWIVNNKPVIKVDFTKYGEKIIQILNPTLRIVIEQGMQQAHLYRSRITETRTADYRYALQYLEDPTSWYQRYFRRTYGANFTDELTGIISNAIREGMNPVQIKGILEEMLRNSNGHYERALMIAETELSRAFNYGADMQFRVDGIKQKEWLALFDACEICVDNSSEGSIPVESSFSSGDSYPPAHPRCRCTVAAVI